jgi:hypothetical protein
MENMILKNTFMSRLKLRIAEVMTCTNLGHEAFVSRQRIICDWRGKIYLVRENKAYPSSKFVRFQHFGRAQDFLEPFLCIAS